MESLEITLKWSKKTFPMMINLGETGRAFKEEVQSLTNVPVDRQKLLSSKKKGSVHWKGSLADDFVFQLPGDAKPMKMVVTLIGSAEAAFQAPQTKTRFVEDMTQEELQAVEDAAEQAAMTNAVGIISSIQLPAHHRNDGKQETYQYNRLVTGLPQRYIEDLLKQRKRKQELKRDDEIMDQVAMTMGLELRRAYVNDLAVRQRDGTLISALDDGHVQLWRHGQLEHDVIHDGGDGGIDSVVALSTPAGSQPSFATAGRGTYKLWSEDAEQLGTIRTPVPGVTPVSLVQVSLPQNDSTNLICLAASLKVVHQSNPSQFHLVPQNEEQRQRRAAAEAQEASMQQIMTEMSSTIQVLYGYADGRTPLQSYLLTNRDVAPITSVTNLVTKQNGHDKSFLVAGDQEGYIRVWEAQVEKQNDNDIVNFSLQSTFQLRSEDGSAVAIVCLEPLGQTVQLAVSTAPTGRPASSNTGPHVLIPVSRAVHVLKLSNLVGNSILPTISNSLIGHAKDAVICMRALPDGGLLTGGGKLDATVQLWSLSQLSANNNIMEGDGEEGATNESKELSKSSQTITTLGYVFALEILPDRMEGSSQFAIAGARYNTVKIIL